MLILIEHGQIPSIQISDIDMAHMYVWASVVFCYVALSLSLSVSLCLSLQ